MSSPTITVSVYKSDNGCSHRQAIDAVMAPNTSSHISVQTLELNPAEWFWVIQKMLKQKSLCRNKCCAEYEIYPAQDIDKLNNIKKYEDTKLYYHYQCNYNQLKKLLIEKDSILEEDHVQCRSDPYDDCYFV